MTSMYVRVEVCDVCHDKERPIENYRIAGPEASRVMTVALCAEHAQLPLTELVTLTREASSSRNTRKRGERAVLDEEGLRRTRTAKKAPASKRK